MSITQRRGPIAAEFAGPGPAAITLPSLFGSRVIIIMIIEMIVMMTMMVMPVMMMMIADPKVHESTKIKAPAYSFGGKTKDLSSTVSPAPNSYNTSGLTSKVVSVTIFFSELQVWKASIT